MGGGGEVRKLPELRQNFRNTPWWGGGGAEPDSINLDVVSYQGEQVRSMRAILAPLLKLYKAVEQGGPIRLQGEGYGEAIIHYLPRQAQSMSKGGIILPFGDPRETITNDGDLYAANDKGIFVRQQPEIYVRSREELIAEALRRVN
ncbi:hypothetical protein JW998_15800 [candidate division KSB1 bacterium]|nr:hypothetical protein [candidate division KSB1 bacterium]